MDYNSVSPKNRLSMTSVNSDSARKMIDENVKFLKNLNKRRLFGKKTFKQKGGFFV